MVDTEWFNKYSGSLHYLAATIVSSDKNLTITVSPSTLTTLVQLSMPVVAVWNSSKVLSFSLRKRDVFPTPNSPSKTTLYVGPLLGAAIILIFNFGFVALSRDNSKRIKVKGRRQLSLLSR